MNIRLSKAVKPIKFYSVEFHEIKRLKRDSLSVRPFAVAADQATPPNLNFWDMKTGECVKSATQKQLPRW